jgi:hypothetical protein
VITMHDRELYILGKQAAEAALTKGSVEQARRLSDLAHQSYFGGSSAFNTSTEAFIKLLNQLWGAVPGNLVHYQKILLYSNAQQAVLEYRDQARSCKRISERSDNTAKILLSGLAKKLLN